MNRRIIYNRAPWTSRAAPWNPDKPVIQWRDGKWVGDVVDAAAIPAPNTPSSCRRTARARSSGRAAKTGRSPSLRTDGSPFEKHAFSAQRSNPVAFKAIGEVLAVADERFPFIGTTYRVTEHWQTGGQTRTCPALNEAMPEQFVEMSVELAAEKGHRERRARPRVQQPRVGRGHGAGHASL